ncbi:MAG: imidazolonepropionase [Hyphomonadaceae bacterium]
MIGLRVYEDCNLATLQSNQSPFGLIEDAKLVIEDGKIAWVGAATDLPDLYSSIPSESLGGRLVTPVLIDCHTHLVFGGNRAREFEMRLEGASYEEIARAGGGILSTVKATRAASFEALVASALVRLDCLISEGVGVVEIKSGYGLTIEHEVRMLRVARRLAELRHVEIVTTWLAAHALPPEYKDRADAYIDDVVIAGLKIAHSEDLVDAVDGFCETIGFTPAQIRRVFDAAMSLGLPVKLHAEQLSDQKGALLAAGYGALSSDHLEYLPPADVGTFAKSGAVAVLLPGAFYTLRESQFPPLAALREHGVPVAIATDCNPGSSPLTSLLSAMNMGCTLFGLTPEEAFSGVTRHAAKALGIQDRFGVIEAGRPAELAVWNVDHPAELSYWMGGSPLYSTISMKEDT